MSKKYILTCLISGLLSLLAFINCLTFIDDANLWNMSYFLFTLLGISGTALSIVKLKYGRWLLISFYCIQLVQIKGELTSFNFTPGFAMPIGFVIGTSNVPVNEHVGVGINIVAVVLLVMCIKWLKIRDLALS
ncbi:hypothetical protein [Photobacterium rosenbergii]|uniref:hypothetical protein n=1 Tax=Photobacterium rosenbergii TaxID=294936 RepID=UPI001C99FE1D|nr:hypothetical protein [Photobacterium rosenbergii]MBY5947745.1 hypothetical protein [Photobacterium rosenbergii]